MSTRQVWRSAAWILLLILLPSAPAVAGPYLPPGLVLGELYQLMFVTQGERDASSFGIDAYNTFVNAEAALNPALTGTDVGLKWFAIASTIDAHAKDNAAVSAPVYLLNGQRFADGFADMWDGIGQGVSPNIDQFGTMRSSLEHAVWTGTDTDGTADVLGLHPLTTLIRAGDYEATTTAWILSSQTFVNSDSFPLYALSQPIKAAAPPSVPEPARALLLAAGTAGLLRLRRRREHDGGRM
jgi:hypothetical protein